MQALETIMERTWAFPGVPEQIKTVRDQVRVFLGSCPAADDAILVISELATNAVLHGSSQGGTFIIRVTCCDTYVHVEVEDDGGPWVPAPSDGRPHGLDIVSALARVWGIRGSPGRTVWARIEI